MMKNEIKNNNLSIRKKILKETKITAWECFVDQVNRIQSVVELHDFLAECNKEDWKLLLERFEG